jgi:hypothetical protein
MPVYQERTDRKTESAVHEALALQRAFGDAAARTLLELWGVDAEVAARVISAPLRMIRSQGAPPPDRSCGERPV